MTTYTEDELKAKVKEAIDKETEGLKAKRDELLGENKKLKDAQKALDDRLKELETAQEEAERIKAEKDGDVKKALEAAEKKWNKERDALIAERDDAKGRVQKHLVDGGLTEALVAAGVAKEYMPAAKALLKSESKFEVSDDGVTVNGKAMKEFVSEWAQGDAGKPYIAADRNGGGGAQGANGGGKANTEKTVKRSEFNEMNAEAKAKHFREGGAVVDD